MRNSEYCNNPEFTSPFAKMTIRIPIVEDTSYLNFPITFISAVVALFELGFELVGVGGGIVATVEVVGVVLVLVDADFAFLLRRDFFC